MSTSTQPEREQSFAETALRLGGKTEEEARRTGALDKADEQVEALFKPQYRTENSPVHKAVWGGKAPLELFQSPDPLTLPSPPGGEGRVRGSAPCDATMDKSYEIVRRHRDAGTINDDKGKVSPAVLRELG